jgi:hypothetical protein
MTSSWLCVIVPWWLCGLGAQRHVVAPMGVAFMSVAVVSIAAVPIAVNSIAGVSRLSGLPLRLRWS